MDDGGSGLPDERVRRALAHLGADSASAPEVPPSVTARITAALRAAPHPPAHAVNSALPRLSRGGLLALIVGVVALGVAIAVGVAALLHTAPARRFPVGPTAERITVPAPASATGGLDTVVTRP